MRCNPVSKRAPIKTSARRYLIILDVNFACGFHS